MNKTLLVVPTYLEDSWTGGPTRGALRLQTAAKQAEELIASTPANQADVIIAGGWRPDPTKSEAQRLYNQFESILVGLKTEKNMTTVVQAEGKCTVDDMRALASWLKTQPYDSITICAHPDQARLARRTLQASGVKVPVTIKASGEPPPYSRITLASLRFLSAVDPLWRTPLSWLPRLLVSARGLDE